MSDTAAPRTEAEAGEMAKKVFWGVPGESGVGDAVRAWLDAHGIEPGMVVGYSVFQHVGEVPRIMLEMYFDDTPPTDGVETASITVKVSPELITQLGEWSEPVQVKIERQRNGTYEMIAHSLTDVTGIDKAERETVSRETSPAAQVYLIGERGPEMVGPEPTLITVLRADHRSGEHAKNRNGACPLCYPTYDPSAPGHQTESDEKE